MRARKITTDWDGQYVIDIAGLWTKFGDFVVHRNLDLQVRSGEILALVGGSGSGKTTLLRQMLGLETPSQGSVKLFGQRLDRLDADGLQSLRNRWGVLFQEGALYSALPVFDNLALPLRELKCFDEELIREVVLMKLAMVGIEARHARAMPSDLSGGMVKRVALARALALEPELLFLDEPTAGLDPDRSDSFVALIRDLHRELKLTVVMVTHDLDTLFELSTSVAVLADQRVLVNAPVRDVIAVPHPFIKKFFLGERAQRAIEVIREYPFVV
ncbi:MAG TPA: ATP-binding cassette domain-containing protein [Burkholderiales bacterium]|jgi:phospholipid/cholesterol/gamma-HCH transport system ATP-binding protein